ncbi:dTDP-4-dehydrorhamnose 3,5-epimerase family protein [Labedaea rhizosphaerae]|uniref:dTDP-4-dehydrorhamnose 3,5-epimerase n=1 Tax=Labedaea rhizosphaerae TaxID=598644 RepID=A0A4R6S4W3_LABRH|nr:dTDP-4-dehydrorhamnose 3,5-epimerase [Labedaea rhizosphaerae]TDP93775.1 dTDP-4-dehydrorhamnose 3,5-epimerase [Labedaea rhizosphaerae]
MKWRKLAIDGAVEFTPAVFPDSRGMFVAPFQQDALVEAVGHPMRLAQTNHSVSSAGVIRGVHFADVPPSQAKYVYCPRGVVLDVVVDLRVGSPTFGQWEAVRLEAAACNAVYIAEGLGHAMMALEDDTVLSYLCSESYAPQREHGITPLDETLALPWPAELTPVLSPKDAGAPTLAQAQESGLLPDYAACLAYYDKLRAR